MTKEEKVFELDEFVRVTDVKLKSWGVRGFIIQCSYPYYVVELDNGKTIRVHYSKIDSEGSGIYIEDDPKSEYFYMIVDTFASEYNDETSIHDIVRFFDNEDEVNATIKKYVDNMWDESEELDENELKDYFSESVIIYEVNRSTLEKNQVFPDVQMETTVKI